MKTKSIETITNNEDYIRLRIFDGEFTPDEAYQELWRLEKEQRKSSDYWNDFKIKYLLEKLHETKS